MDATDDDAVVVAKGSQQQSIELTTIGESQDNSSNVAEDSAADEQVPTAQAVLKPRSTDHIDCCKSDCCLYNDWDTLPRVNPCCSSPERPCCMKGESCMERAFEGIGVVVARRPWLSMVLSMIVVLACASGYAFVEDENRPDKLWIPEGSPALFHKEYVDQAWPSSQRFALYIATCGDVEEGEPCNVLQARYIKELERINNEIMAIEVDTAYALEAAGVPPDTPTP